MKKLVLVFVLLLILSSCAGLITKWECGSAPCIDRERAYNKCLAQANAAFSKNKPAIWEQCMRGEGFVEVPCARGEKNPDCRLLHAW